MKTAIFVKQSRKALGFTQQQLADLLNKDRSLISHYESGYSIPPGNIILKLIALRFPTLCLSDSHLCTSQRCKKQGCDHQETANA